MVGAALHQLLCLVGLQVPDKMPLDILEERVGMKERRTCVTALCQSEQGRGHNVDPQKPQNNKHKKTTKEHKNAKECNLMSPFWVLTLKKCFCKFGHSDLGGRGEQNAFLLPFFFVCFSLLELAILRLFVPFPLAILRLLLGNHFD